MTSKQKGKGYYYEKKTEDFLNTIRGWKAKRQLASGAYGKLDARLDGDILLSVCPNSGKGMCGFDIDSGGCDGYDSCPYNRYPEHEDITYKVEVKARDGDFPKWLEKSFEQGDITVAWKCGVSPARGYIIMPLETFWRMIG